MFSFHEFLHIALEEKGAYLEFERSPKKLQTYLFELKNLFDDYLIETEIRHQFDRQYESNFEVFRVRDNYALNCLVHRVRNRYSPTQIFMELLSIRNICTNVYRALKERKAARATRDFMKSSRFDKVIKISKNYAFSSIDKESYQEGIKRIHEALTESSLRFKKDHRIRLNNLSKVNEFLEGLNESFLFLTDE